MTQRQAIEILDRTLQDIMGCIEPFGGKVIAFGGDFRQVLPVVPRGTSRVFLPTSGTKPPPTGSGKPDRFDRLPEKTGHIQNPNQKLMFNQFLSASRPVYRFGLTGYRSV